MIILPYLEHAPQIGSRVAAYPTSAVIGRTQLGSDCTLGELTLMRADGEEVRIGVDCWFGEASTVHIADKLYPAIIGSRVTVGRYSLVHACTVGDDCVIGEHAAIMDGSVLGAGSVIAAESVVPPGKTLEGGWLYAGAPALPVERVTGALLDHLHRAMRAGSGTEEPPCIFAAARVPGLRHAAGFGLKRICAEGAYVAPTASIAGRV